MASEKTSAATAPVTNFNWADVMPADQKKDAHLLADTGKLYPIYDMQEALDQKWSPVYGKLITITPLSEVDGPDGKRTPIMILVEHTGAPTKGKLGTAKTGYTIVDVKAGDMVMVPIGGNLEVNQEILRAATDPVNIYSAGFRCAGAQKVNNAPSKMLVIEAKLFPKTEKREGKYLVTHSTHAEIRALFERWGGAPAHLLPPVARTANGTPYNQLTGEVS